MLKTTKFKVELEVEVQYEVPEGVATTPYTEMFCYVNNNELVIHTLSGKVADGTLKKIERTGK